MLTREKYALIPSVEPDIPEQCWYLPHKPHGHLHHEVFGRVDARTPQIEPALRRAKLDCSLVSKRSEDIFSALRERWESDTLVQSNVAIVTRHPAYLEIIGLGPTALPLILRALEERPGLWFSALRSIARFDAAEGLETIEGARQAWLDWGRAQHLL